MKTIIEMAREAGFETLIQKGRIFGNDRDGDCTEELEAFAALVRADERNSWPAEMKALRAYIPPAQRTWVGLTDDEITDMWAESSPYYHEDDFARAIEAKLKEKNT